jgi:malate dehydrogenase (quinone)
MLNLLARAFPNQMKGAWQPRIREIVPSYGQELNKSAALVNRIRRTTSQTLQLPYIEVPQGPDTGLQPGPAAEPEVQSQPEVVPQDKRDDGNREMQSL